MAPTWIKHWSYATSVSVLLVVGAPASAVCAGDEPGRQPEPRSIKGPYLAIVDGKEVKPTVKMGDKRVVAKILDEGLNRNQVMEHLTHLTKNIGPRLTGSTNVETANKWALEQYKLWGLKNAHLDEWGTIPVRFDRGPSSGTLYSPRIRRDEAGTETTEYLNVREMEFSTPAWSSGTDGPVRGNVVRLPHSEEEFAAVKDKLAGAWVLISTEPATGRLGVRGGRGLLQVRAEQRKEFHAKKAAGTLDMNALTVDDKVLLAGVAGFISTSRDERVWTGANRGWREMDPASIPSNDIEVTIRLSDYDYINSRLTDGEEIQAEFNLDNRLIPGPFPVYNTIAEIPGTVWPEQVVIVSAHLDSWNGHGSEGCTDNGTGSSVVLEAARILAKVGVRPKRTIRFINWTGEEQGLLGSRAYVDKIESQWPNISACFVDDGGTNYEGGLDLPVQMVPMIAAATAPVNNLFWDDTDGKFLNCEIKTTETYEPHGGSDHYSFYAKGMPGFFWNEIGRADYPYGWHTQNDKLDLAIPNYLKQSSTCMAVTAYNMACADTLLPRWERSESESEGAGRRRNRDATAPAAPGATGGGGTGGELGPAIKIESIPAGSPR